MNFKKIVVLMGGPSSEAEISRLTGTAILNALQEKGYNAVGMEFVPKTLVEDIKESGCDIVFNAVHGKYGEDGRIAAVLEMIDMPYTSCSVLSSAITMDKVASKHLFRSTGISTPNCLIYRKTDTDRNLVEEIANKFSMPVVVKAESQASPLPSTKLFISRAMQNATERTPLVSNFVARACMLSNFLAILAVL